MNLELEVPVSKQYSYIRTTKSAKKKTFSMRHIPLVLLLAMLFSSINCLATGADVPSYWAADEIVRANELDIVPQTLLSHYQDAINREEFAQLTKQTLCVIDPALSDTTLDSQYFSDTDSDAVMFCATLGIVNGYGDGTFQPSLKIKRQEAAKMLYMAAYTLGKATTCQDGLHVFADSEDISTWAYLYVQWVYEAGIMQGIGENQFDPFGTYTREQAVLTMLRLYDYTMGNTGQKIASDRTITCSNGDIRIHNAIDSLSGGTLFTRNYEIFNGDWVTMGSYVSNGAASGTTLVARFLTDSDCGQIKYYDRTNEKWVITELKAGTYNASMICVMSGSVNYFFYTPRAWKIHTNCTLEEMSNHNGYLNIRQGADSFTIELYAYNLGSDHRSDFTCVSSRKESLIDWTHPNAENLWKTYTLEGDGKWCYDGYYFPAPESYIPSGPNYYYRLPAAYLLRSFLAVQSVHRVALDLSLCMMDTLAQQQNSEGFFPTMSGSTWLWDDYGIRAGFYDTRFNSDLVEMFINGYSKYGGDLYFETLQKYSDFYIEYANEHHRTTAKGGWFVDDYYHPTGNRRTHTSLNHQLQEIIVLYKLSDMLSRSDLSALADKLLLAIEDSGADWIRKDKNLHYSYSADGTYGGTDYPYLTYNDLYNLQKLLAARTGKTNDTLTMLMKYKKAWMDTNGVTGYLK